jgi:transcriptional regulator with GAF, ATPase, and Fis domain
LLEPEVFGYQRGAFTSAQQAKPGQIELAAAGVLLLDEVTEMSPAAQAKFLRVLQEHQRLGGTRILKANIRVIAATNRDLRKAVERGDFREDLFYRLMVFDIAIPRETIAQVLRKCRWNRTRAAKRLGLTRTQLYLRLQKYGLEKPPEA